MRTTLLITLFSFLFIAGCVPSLHQLWTNETLIYDDAINGKYQENDNVWEFVGDPDDKSYALTIHEEEDKTSQLTAHLVQVAGQRFLDLYPADDAEVECGDWLKFHLLPVHLFFHVTQTEPNLVIAAMSPDEIGKMLKAQPELVKHECIEDDRVVLTDTPENLQKFVLQGLKIEGFYGKPETLAAIKD